MPAKFVPLLCTRSTIISVYWPTLPHRCNPEAFGGTHDARNRFVDIRRRLADVPKRLLENAQHRFREMEGILRVLGPEATLRRGYSITTNERGELIRTIVSIRLGMKIRTRVSDGEFGSEVIARE